jgi:vacuolar-type H+-ATPase subunit I/STV1
LLFRHQRAIASLKSNVISARRKNSSGVLTPIDNLQHRYESLLLQIKRLLDQDSAWRTRAEALKAQRTELWERATRWSPTWQGTIKGFISETDEALRFARRTKNPEDQIAQAISAVARLRNALEYVEEVNSFNVKATRVAGRVESLQPIDGSYLSQDSLSFRETLAAGQQAFAVGEYVTARRHLDAALRLGKRVVTTERAERLKRKAEARQWIRILGDKKISAEITSVLGHSSSPEFHVEWEELHQKIDDLVLAKACEMGKHDQETIAKRIGIKRTVRWRKQIEWNDLLRFAQAMVKEL